MTPNFSRTATAIVAGIALTFLVFALWSGSRTVEARGLDPRNALAFPTPVAAASGWAGNARSDAAPGGSRVSDSSPVLADLDNNGTTETIFVGTNNGVLVAYNGSNGSVKWSRSVGSVSGFNVGGCATGVIRSSPAVGMLRPSSGGTARKAVVVGVGDNPFTSSTGGVIAFDASNGSVLWFVRMSDWYSWADGCPDGVVSSPTVTDVDKDGNDEVLFGSFDHRFYVLNDNGSNYSAAWPREFLDTMWSSPAVGDINLDGQNEIVIGTDEGVLNVGCPYALDWGHDYCGGHLYVMRLDGSDSPGFPYFTWQVIQSPPALADLNGDGFLDIIFGTGSYYRADFGAYRDTFKVFAVDRNGNNLSGWPVDINGVTIAAPAVGDLNNDGNLEVVIGTSNFYCFQGVCNGPIPSPRVGYIFALQKNGTQLWPTKQIIDSYFGTGTGPLNYPLIADYDNDNQQEILFSFRGEVQILNGANGAHEIGGYNQANNKWMYGYFTIQSAPAVGDINGDNKQEVVAAGADVSGNNGHIYAWTPSNNTGDPFHAWPMFRRNAAHTARLAPPTLLGGPTALTVCHTDGSGQNYTFVFNIQNPGDQGMTLSTSDNSNKIDVQPGSVSIGTGQSRQITIDLTNLNSYSIGVHIVGTIALEATYGGGTQAVGSPRNVTVRAIVANNCRALFLPLNMRP